MKASSTDLRIVSKGATTQEVAAVTAVLEGAIDDLRTDVGIEPAALSAWQRSRRALRGPLRPGPGAWRRDSS